MFSSPQFLVLTLDAFSAKPAGALSRIAHFLGLGAFPRLVTNWKWQWNVGKGAPKKRQSTVVTDGTLAKLRSFFAPYTGALSALLRRRGQARAASHVDQWPRA